MYIPIVLLQRTNTVNVHTCYVKSRQLWVPGILNTYRRIIFIRGGQCGDKCSWAAKKSPCSLGHNFVGNKFIFVYQYYTNACLYVRGNEHSLAKVTQENHEH